ncbi:unnamed protein product [Peronospora belbahrii]|uniref:Uncharacterized protein n=1 Tax=Peronospora belbahrii TaxID=622444 RepID=A0AAU9L3Y7_9STRA|nr:unnamed protein product [Peronospora belbahrii]
MADAQTLDLFNGLPLDYNFLGGGDVSPESPRNATTNSASFAASGPLMGTDDQMLFDSDVPGSSHTFVMTPKAENEDLLTPLSFSFNPNGITAMGSNYRVASQHKHKRVRSNPDVLQGFGMANMASSARTSSIMSLNGMSFHQQHNVMPTGPFEVELPVNPIPFGGIATPRGESFEEMDDFLQNLSWSEPSVDHQQQRQQQQMLRTHVVGIEENGALVNEDASPVSYRSHRIQEGVNELKMKRKRPVNHHSRHHSNPVDLLHNLDQFRILAEQNKQQQQAQQQYVQQQNMHSTQGYLNPFASFQDHAAYPARLQTNMQQYQFQVPPQVDCGTVHSLHGRRSSLGSNMPPRAAARRRGGPNHSSGLSMDMSQMNLGFLSLPEEPCMAELNPHHSPQQRSMNSSASSLGSKKMSIDDANRKLYKCGRCGQPKVGHICTMPDQRNNWTQVDLGVTKGLKVVRINCHVIPVKSKWVTQCDDHEPPQLDIKGDIKTVEESKIEPLGL